MTALKNIEIPLLEIDTAALADGLLLGEKLEDLEYKGLKIIQSEHGYRFTSDSVLLAGLTTAKVGDRVVDLGTGSGVIATLLSARTGAKVWGVEIQQALALRAARSVKLNKLENDVHIVNTNMITAHITLGAGSFNIAVSNPPYAKRVAHFDKNMLDGNPLSENVEQSTERVADEMASCANAIECTKYVANEKQFSEKELCKKEILVTIDEVVGAARRLLRHGGKLYIIYKAERLADLICAMREGGIEPKRLIPIMPNRDSVVDTVIAVGIKGGKPGIVFEAPFIVYEKDGTMTAETKKIYHK